MNEHSGKTSETSLHKSTASSLHYPPVSFGKMRNKAVLVRRVVYTFRNNIRMIKSLQVYEYYILDPRLFNCLALVACVALGGNDELSPSSVKFQYLQLSLLLTEHVCRIILHSCTCTSHHLKPITLRRAHALQVKWIEEHQSNPFPTKAEKQYLAYYSGMNLTQLSAWFATARKRVKENWDESLAGW